MLHVSDSKLYTVRQQVVRQLPLPEEMTVQLDAARLQELLRTIESAGDGADFDMMVARLPRRQLNDLFGLLLVIDSAAADPAAFAGSTANAFTSVGASVQPVNPGGSDAFFSVGSDATPSSQGSQAQPAAKPDTRQSAAPPTAASLRNTLASFFRQAKAANAPIMTPASIPEPAASPRATTAAPGSSPVAASGPGSATQATQAISSGVFLLDDLRRIKERIYQVLERRATLSLAQTGWVFYQQHFFHAELAEAMLRISRVLAAKGEQDVFLSRCMQYGCGEDQPVRIAESWVEDQGRPIHVLKDGWSLAAQLSSLAVVEGGRFGTLLLHAFFTRCPLERIPQETALFGVALELATTDEQAQMLTALYGDYRLEPAFDAVSQLVLKHCGMPRKGNDHPVWGSVSQQVRQHFRQWALINMVSQHVEGQSRKLAFYQPLLMRLFDCVQLNPDVLMLEFPQFYLLDHKDFSHQVVYYEKPTLQLALESKSDPETLSIPQGQWSTARDLILNQNRSNRVLLKLEEVNLLYARDFIESVQNPGKRSSVI